jgi:hypothetical protein
VTIIAQAVHMHKLGKRVTTSRKRRNPKSGRFVELQPLAGVAFDYNFQTWTASPEADKACFSFFEKMPAFSTSCMALTRYLFPLRNVQAGEQTPKPPSPTEKTSEQKLMRGDELAMACEFDSTERSTVTKWGYSTRDEVGPAPSPAPLPPHAARSLRGRPCQPDGCRRARRPPEPPPPASPACPPSAKTPETWTPPPGCSMP